MNDITQDEWTKEVDIFIDSAEDFHKKLNIFMEKLQKANVDPKTKLYMTVGFTDIQYQLNKMFDT